MDNPPHNGTDTSRAAAESVTAHVPRLEQMVLDSVAAAGPDGRTCYEVEFMTGLSHQTASARITSLSRRGALVDSGQRRLTITGRKAIVWVAP